MSKQKELVLRLQQHFAPHFIQVENESHLHRSGRGDESHFKIVLVSESFEGMTKIARHRCIYELLALDLQQGIHALALHLYTPTEWQKLGEAVPCSTTCAGHGK